MLRCSTVTLELMLDFKCIFQKVYPATPTTRPMSAQSPFVPEKTMFKFGVAALAMLATVSAVPSLDVVQTMFVDFTVKVCGLFTLPYARKALCPPAWGLANSSSPVFSQYHKAYSTQEEYNSRLSVFRSNLEIAEQLTATGTSTHGVTQFMDLTPEEFKAMYTGFDPRGFREALGDIPVARVM